MKIKVLLASFFLALGCYCHAQTVQPDERLLERYNQEYLTNLSQNSPITLELLNFSLDNVWYITDDNAFVDKTLPYLYFVDVNTGKESQQRVNDINDASFNIVNYYYEQDYARPTAYRIGNTGKVLVIRSVKDITLMYNQQKGAGHE